MKEYNLSGSKRSDVGKKATKLMRKEGLVPCNLYGEAKDASGKPVALSFSVSAADVRKLIYSPDVFIVNLTIEGEAHTAIIRELQFHPVSDKLLHIDFLEVTADKPITIGIPVKLTGLAQGVRDGGRMALIVRKINVKALYKDIPETLNIDVTDLTIGKSIKVGQLQFEGLEMATSKEVVVCTIKATRKSNAAAKEATEAEAK